MDSTTLTSVGRNLLAFDFAASTDHIKDFEWSTFTFAQSFSRLSRYFSFFLLVSLVFRRA